MRFALLFITLLSLSLMVGCKSGTETSSTLGKDTGVLDVSHPTPSAEPAAQPIYDQPVVQTPVVQQVGYTPVQSTTPVVSGNSYTVKKGDTLSSIARAKYGSGDWKKIAAANPGLDPNHIKVGQKINLP